MKEDFINIGFEATDLSLIERCEEIYRIHSVIGNSLAKQNWLFTDRKLFNLKDKSFFIQTVLNKLKSEIRKHTILKEVPDNFMDTVFSSIGFFGSSKYDDGLVIRYTLGRTSGIISLANILIDNIDDFFGNDIELLKSLLKDISSTINIKQIVIPDLVLAEQIRAVFPANGIVRTDFD